jgi:hypothetical protein
MKTLVLGKLAGQLASWLVPASLIIYLLYGYNPLFLVLWLLGLILFGIHFWQKRNNEVKLEPVMERIDWAILYAISIVTCFIYLPLVYDYPLQGNTDEITILGQILQMVHDPRTNPLGPSHYKGFPTLVHLAFGWIALALGGINFEHVRMVHALCGAFCVLLSFVFFRTLAMPRFLAVSATILLGLNHSLVVISRMLSRNNTTILIEVVALSLLFRGFLRRCPFLLYLGGIIAGLSFYTYTPARTIMFSFLLPVALIACFSKDRKPPLHYLELLWPALLSFTITVVPMVWGTAVGPRDPYPMSQFLLTRSGLDEQKDNMNAKTDMEAIWINVRNGLETFNWPIPDAQGIYWHPNFGFVDPITGLMIWVGLIGIILLRKKRAAIKEADILCLSGFISLDLLYTFVVNYAPNYTRLFAILPFLAYLSAYGVQFTADLLRKLIELITGRKLPGLSKVFFVPFIVLAAAYNLFAMYKYLQEGDVYGDVVTPIYRIIERESKVPNKTFMLAADDKYKFFLWREPSDWIVWMGSETLPVRLKIITSDQLKDGLKLDMKNQETQLAGRPFRLFLNKQLWAAIQPTFEKTYPNFSITRIVPDGQQLTIDVK